MSRLSRSLFLLATLALPACVAHVREPVPVAEEVVMVEPPAPQTEVIGTAPSAEHFWIPGHWRWEGRRHVWYPGHWEQRRAGYQWVPGRWQHQHHGYVWVEGHWERT